MYIKNIGKVSVMSLNDKKKIFNEVTNDDSKKVSTTRKVKKNIPLKLKQMARKKWNSYYLP